MRVEAQEKVLNVASIPVRPEPVEPKAIKQEPRTEKLATQAGKPIDREALENAVELANKVMEITDRHLVFKLHEKSGRYQVSVVENGAGGEKIIRKIPSDKMLEMAAELREKMDQATGLLLNELG